MGLIMARGLPLAAAFTLTLGGCYSLRFALEPTDADTIQMTRAKNVRVLKHFSETASIWYLFGGLIPLGQPELGKILRPHVDSKRRVANLTIRTVTWFDAILVSTVAVEIEGDEVVAR